MNVLFIKEDRLLIDELKDYMQSLKAIAFFADNLLEIEKIHRENFIDLVIVPLKTLSSLELLNFINEEFKETKVIITIDHYNTNVNWKNRRAIYTNYALIQKQLRLYKLKKAIRLRFDYYSSN